MNAGRKKVRMQGKTNTHAHSVLRSQVMELLRSTQLKTTPAKAKLLRAKVDRLFTLVKRNTPGALHEVESYLHDSRPLNRLMEFAKVSSRNSGFVRLIRTLPRKGDGAEQMYVMLTDVLPEKKAEGSKELQKVLSKQSKSK